MIYLLIKRTSDGYDDNTSWLEGVYSDKDVANAKKESYVKERKLLEKQIEEADERESAIWTTWEDEGLRQKYSDEGLSDLEINEKYYQEEQDARNGVQDYLWDDYVNYKVIELKVDSDNGLIIL